MALIKCPECGKEISNTIENCIHCGYKIQKKETPIDKEDNKDKETKNKSLVKDIAILLSVWGPILFIIIGSSILNNGGFDGTIMENLFPALFLGFVVGFLSLIIVSNIFKRFPVIWIIVGILVFIATVVLVYSESIEFITISKETVLNLN